MTSKNQHYIPRLLQRGFLHDPEEKAERTWLHRQGVTPRLVGISGVGSSEYFYSRLSADGKKTLDDEIKATEDVLGAQLAAFRRTQGGHTVDAGTAARMTVHLMLRTAHLRSVFSQAAAQLFEGVEKIFGDTAAVRQQLGVDLPEESAVLRDAFDKALQDFPLEAHSIPRQLARRILSFMAREQFDAMYEDNRQIFADVIRTISRQIPEMVRDAHNKALGRSSGDAWERYLQTLHWRLHNVSGAILPDCVVLAREFGRDFAPFLMSERDNVDLVVMPLAHDRLLIGSLAPEYGINSENLNSESASCCDTFYISRRREDGEGLSHLIGQRSAQFIESRTTEALAHIPRIDSGGDPETRPIPVESGDDRNLASNSFATILVGLEQTPAETALGEIAHSVVYELRRSMPLSSLERIIFAEDLEKAVFDIDRGSAALNEEEAPFRDFGFQIAKSVDVVRDGEKRSQIVFDMSVAKGLLCESANERSSALHVLANMLACVSHRESHGTKLNSAAAQPPDDVAQLLLPAVLMAPCKYFGTRESAFIDPAAGVRFSSLVLESLLFARKTIESARLRYRVDGDLDTLLRKALPPISFALEHAAEWLGHRDGLPNEDHFPGSALPTTLRDFGLSEWLHLFGRDLKELHAAEDHFTSLRVFSLSKHVERLLWTVQLFPWLTEENSVYVTVPYGNDISLLQASSETMAQQQTKDG